MSTPGRDGSVRAEYDRRYAEIRDSRIGSDGAQLLARFARPPGKVLDLGSGNGSGALVLAEAGWDVEGVDFSSEGVRIARESAARLGVTAVFHEADVREFDPSGRDYRHVLASNITNFLDRPAGLALLARCRDSIPEGGLHVIRCVLESDPELITLTETDVAAEYARWETLTFSVEEKNDRAGGARYLTAVFKKRN